MKNTNKNYASMNNQELLELYKFKDLKLPTSIKNELNSFSNDYKIEYARKYVVDELEKLDNKKNHKRSKIINISTLVVSTISLLISLCSFLKN